MKLLKISLFRIFILLSVCLVSAPVLFAQEIVDGVTQTDPPAIEDVFQTFASLVAIIPFLTEFFKKVLGKTEASPSLAVQIFSWVVGLFLAIMGKLLGLGFLAELSWIWVIAYGMGAALAANGVADTKIIKRIFALFQKSA